MRSPCRTRRCCGTTKIIRLFMWRAERISSGADRLRSARAKTARRKSRAGFRPERTWWETAACFYSSRIRSNTEAAGFHDPPDRTVFSEKSICDHDVHRVDRGGWDHFVSAHAGGRVSGPLAADGGDHYAVAGARGGRSRAIGDAADRSRNERRAKDGDPEVDLALRPIGHHPDVRRRYRQLFRAADRVPAAERGHISERSVADACAAVESFGIDLPICAGEPGPFGAGIEDV